MGFASAVARAATARQVVAFAAAFAPRDLLMVGAYRKGGDPAVDEAVARMPAIEAFLRQPPTERADPAETLRRLVAAAG